jgi:hypothetical protein
VRVLRGRISTLRHKDTRAPRGGPRILPNAAEGDEGTFKARRNVASQAKGRIVMQIDSQTTGDNRPLTDPERQVVQWMLEHGSREAKAFLEQLANAEVTPWRCPCGCASINFQIKGYPKAPPGVHVLADFFFGSDEELSGIFVYENAGILSGLEVYGLMGNAPKTLPSPDLLRPFGHSSSACQGNSHG